MRTAVLLVPLTVLALLAGCTGSDGDDDLATCLAGEWTPDVDAQLAASDALMAATGMSGTTAISGESVTTIDATTMSTTYTDHVVELTATLEGQTFVSTTRTNGTRSQPYTLDGDVLTVLAGDRSDLRVESTVTLDGQPLPGYDQERLQALASGGSAQSARTQVTCSGDRLTLTTHETATLGVDDLTIVFTRR